MGAEEAAAAEDVMPLVRLLIVLFFYVGLPLLLLGGSWLIHHLILSSRRKYLTMQEAYFRERIPMTNLKQFPAAGCSAPALVTGSAVIANNYFVSFASAFKHIFGGELRGYTGMCSDARRLALVRMLQEAEQLGADGGCNVRFETATIVSANNQKQSGGVELIAYGTAFKKNRP